MGKLILGGGLMAQLKHADNYWYDVVRNNIRKYRKEKKYTQQRLAEEAELSVDYICEIESLRRNKSFSLATLGRISDVLEINIKDFFKENEEKGKKS